MNKNSLSYSYSINQQKPLWIDDPFSIKGTFAGVANMNHQRALEEFAQELVEEYGRYDGNHYILLLDSLPEEEQNELVRLYIEYTGRDLTECVNGDDFTIDNDYTCALLSMLMNDCQETRDRFSEVTRTNILLFYKKSLEELLESACENFLHDSMNEQGYFASRDLEQGDVVWGKF